MVTDIGQMGLKITRSKAGTHKLGPLQGLGFALQFNHPSTSKVSQTGAAQFCRGTERTRTQDIRVFKVQGRAWSRRGRPLALYLCRW